MAIALDDPLFVFGEAVEITRFDAKDLNNWTQREILSLGTMHRSGRRMYSIADLIRLAIAGGLAPTMRPAFAVAVAQSHVIKPRLLEIAALDDKNNLKHRGYYGKDEPHYLVAFAEPSKDNFAVRMVKESQLLIGVLQQGRQAITMIRPSTTVVMFDELAKAITNKAVNVFEREEQSKQD